MIPTDAEYKKGSEVLVTFLAAERASHAKTREQLDATREQLEDCVRFIQSIWDNDRTALLENQSIAFREDDGTMTTLPEAIRQRESARNWAVMLEQENARLAHSIEDVRSYARETLIGNWTSDGIGNDLLCIINGEARTSVVSE